MLENSKTKKINLVYYPLVTIGVPTYNSGKYIKEYLNSIIVQSYTELEIIVSENGYADNTNKIMIKSKNG